MPRPDQRAPSSLCHRQRPRLTARASLSHPTSCPIHDYAAPSRPRHILLAWPLSATSAIHPIPIRRAFLLTAYLRLHGGKQVRLPVFACPVRAPGVVAVSNLTIGRGLPNPIGRHLHAPVRRRLCVSSPNLPLTPTIIVPPFRCTARPHLPFRPPLLFATYHLETIFVPACRNNASAAHPQTYKPSLPSVPTASKRDHDVPFGAS
ncbi:hypothetical protein B0H13DRAFT_2670361 [Mycena leptocephala]|nr:hypothetical protein B0H13DRAFT_2362585 [Mycena leptocephala]KAJ7868133.1 hypothetical protein B0H13DRAFT_2670361 [Mycena leptocephala]